MADYTLTISKMVKNPDYDPDARRYGNPAFPEWIEERQLTCVITDEEFAVIKHALVEVWK